MLSDKLKQQARLSILEKLKQKGMPGLDMSPVPAPMDETEMGAEAPEETLNDMDLSPDSLPQLKRKKKPVGPVNV